MAYGFALVLPPAKVGKSRAASLALEGKGWYPVPLITPITLSWEIVGGIDEGNSGVYRVRGQF